MPFRGPCGGGLAAGVLRARWLPVPLQSGARCGRGICIPLGACLFFQAEDGIRDKLVTGVQTCALPICERELAMRVALGAGRGRLARQCLTESGVLGLAGSVFGILLAALAFRPFIALWPGTLPRAREIFLDWHVLLFALAVCLFSSLLFGLAPALRAPVRNVEQARQQSCRGDAASSRRWPAFLPEAPA